MAALSTTTIHPRQYRMKQKKMYEESTETEIYIYRNIKKMVGDMRKTKASCEYVFSFLSISSALCSVSWFYYGCVYPCSALIKKKKCSTLPDYLI